MKLSELLSSVSTDVGAAKLRGGIVFAALDRPIDKLIQLAMGLGPYHPGQQSPWSHTFLLAGDFAGLSTPILDCTIRDGNGKVAWNEPLTDVLETGLAKSGGIYTGTVGDYDDPRVTNVGLKLLLELSDADRAAIVSEASKLQAAGYRYDIPGLVRELARLLTGIAIPAGDHLLFCSAFCQSAYRNALSNRGDFAPALNSEDVTPDDIWYSQKGTPYPKAAAARQTFFLSKALPKSIVAETATSGFDNIEHIVVLMLENRSFDHMLGFLKAVDARIDGLTGTESNPSGPGPSATPVAVKDDAQYKGQLNIDPGHDQPDVGLELYGSTQYDFSQPPTNSGFVVDYTQRNNGDNLAGSEIMSCFSPKKLPVLASLAQEFCVCDRWFSSIPGPTWPNRFFAHAATSNGFVDNKFRTYSIDTIYHRLEEAGLSWGIYYHDIPQSLAISTLWGDIFKAKIHRIQTFFDDARNDNLPRYSFIEPRYFEFFFTKKANDEHPPHDVLMGETLISDVYNALRASPSWEKTLLVILYDEHGGIYDHVPPEKTVNPDGKNSQSPSFDFTRLGVRVPAVLVSPLIPRGSVDHTLYDHTSLLATVRKRFNLAAPLTNRDAGANTFDSNLSLTTARTDTPRELFPAGASPQPLLARAAVYAPLSPDAAKAALAAGEASAAPLSEFQQSLVELAGNLDVSEPPAAAMLTAATPIETEHAAAVQVRDRVARFLNQS